MEQLNRIEIRGNVGTVRLQPVGENLAAHFTVATSYAYKTKDGNPVIETTWHNVNAWQGKGAADLDKITKGSKVFVSGRMCARKYQDADGLERTSYEINARTVSLIEDSENLQCEF